MKNSSIISSHFLKKIWPLMLLLLAIHIIYILPNIEVHLEWENGEKMISFLTFSFFFSFHLGTFISQTGAFGENLGILELSYDFTQKKVVFFMIILLFSSKNNSLLFPSFPSATQKGPTSPWTQPFPSMIIFCLVLRLFSEILRMSHLICAFGGMM